MEENKIDYNSSGVNPIVPVQQTETPLSDMSKRSRLNRHLERQSKKTLAISILGLILIILVLFKFGIPFIAAIGSISGQVAPAKQSGNASQSTSPQTFLAPPTLNQTFDATNSAQVEISGSSTTGNQVAIYLNGSLFEKVDLGSDNTFKDNLTLSTGDNIIKAKSVNGSHESDFSDSITITYKNSPPNLSIDSVHDGDSVKSSPVNIGGKTDPEDTVTVDGFQAIVDSQGGYSYSLNLQNGDNNVVVDAIDNAGNKTEKTIKVTYSP